MLRRAVSLILLGGFLAAGLAGPALAAPNLIIRDRDGEERHSYQIALDQGPTSYDIYVSLSEPPAEQTAFSVCSTGYLVFHLAGGDYQDIREGCNQLIGFFMTPTNYQNRRIILQYEGNGRDQPDKKGKVTVENADLGLTKAVNFATPASANEDDPKKDDPAKEPEGNPNAGLIDLSKVEGSALTLDQAFTRAVGGAFWLIAFLAFLALMIGGIQYITAGGDANRAAEARRTIIWSLIGVVVALISYVLVRFVSGLIGG